MHFGIADGSLPAFLLYYGGIVAFLLSCLWKPEIGLYFVVPALPLQTIRYRLHDMPMGALFVDIMLLGVAIGLIRQRRAMPKTPLNKILVIFAGLTYVLLWRGSMYLNQPFPIWFDNERLSDWKNYMVMPVLFLLVVAAIRTTSQIKVLLLLMTVSVVLVDKSFVGTMSGRDMSGFSYDMRDAGALGYAGENGLGAFEAQFSILLLGLLPGVTGLLKKGFLLGVFAYSALALMYSFSRGAYLGFLTGVLFLGIVKQRKLLLLLALFLFLWQSLVPPAVIERVFMTRGTNGEIESSAAERLSLWDEAMRVFEGDPAFGIGFNTYGSLQHVGGYSDTHNLFVKVMVETGVAGLVVFTIMLYKMYSQGYKLFRQAGTDPILRALGLGFSGMMITLLVANFFGDRWTYLQISGYTWTALGLVVRGNMIGKEDQDTSRLVGAEAIDSSDMLLTPA